MDEANHLREVLDSLPIGVYELDSRDRPIYANRKALNLLGYSNLTEFADRTAREFYAIPSEEHALKSELFTHQSVTNHAVHLRVRSGDSQLFSVTAVRKSTAAGKYIGSVGTLRPVSPAEYYSKYFIDDVPVGLFLISMSPKPEKIVHCNRKFARILGYASPSDLVNTLVSGIHSNPDAHSALLEELLDRPEPKSPLVGHHLNLRAKDGTAVPVELNVLPFFDQHGVPIFRLGSIQDTADFNNRRNELDDLAHGAGRFTHVIHHSLVNVRLLLGPALSEVIPASFSDSQLPSAKLVMQALTVPIGALAAAAQAMAITARGRPLSRPAQAVVDGMPERVHLLESLASLPEEHRAGTAYHAALSIREDIRELRKASMLPREMLREMERPLHDIIRICNSIDLLQAKHTLLDAAHDTNALTERLTVSVRRTEQRGLYRLSALVDESLGVLKEYASLKGVTCKMTVAYGVDDGIKVVKREVSRALQSILHNAIKYSWARGGANESQELPWVDIKIWGPAGGVHMSVQNWGVPITQDELKRELVFELGYRGIYSDDRGRSGTGIGLTDARRVIQAAGGEIAIESVATGPTSDKLNYNAPFLTTVTIRLPRPQKRWLSDMGDK